MGKRQHQLLTALMAGLLTVGPWELSAASNVPLLIEQPSDELETSLVHSISIRTTVPDKSQEVDAQVIKARMRTKEKDLFMQSAFDADLKMLAEQFDRVDPLFRQTALGLDIVLEVTPRPILRKLVFEGNQGLGRRRLEKESKLKTQSPLDRKEVIQGMQKVREAYIKKGYFEAQVEPEFVPVPGEHAVDVVVRVREGRSGVIDSIRFEGFSPKEESEALEKMNTKEWFFLTSWATKEGTFRPEMVEHDRLQVLTILQNHGYADARLSVKVEEVPNKKRIAVVLVADKGPLYTVGEISFEGNHLFSNKEIWDCFQMRPGDAFSPERVRDTASTIKDLYGSKGFIEAEANFVTELQRDRPVYNLKFRLVEGEAYKVGMVRIFGNEQTQSRVILRECLLIPGDVFDIRRLKATERRLENIGYFKSVNVYAVKTPSKGGLGEQFRDVYIEVEEQQTGSINFNAGYGTSEGITAGLEFTERNFNFAGITDLRQEGLQGLRGGGEYLHARASWGDKQSVLGLNWLDPYFRDSLWRIGFDLSRTNGTLQSQDLPTINEGIVLRAAYPLNPYWALSTRYRFVREYTDVVLPNGDEVRLYGASGTVSGISASLALDTTNKPWDPTTGLRSELKAEFAGVGGSTKFATFSWLNTFYSSVWPAGTVKYRLDFNFLQPWGTTKNILEIPYNERFFLGGDQTVRGYKPFIIGPLLGPERPLGGLSSGLASVEWSLRVYKEWRIFAFIDAGQISADTWTLPWPWRMSAGFGATVPVFGQAPITLGLGWPINPERPEDVRRFYFTMGSTF
jgi:outer membrane protein insertion porin family